MKTYSVYCLYNNQTNEIFYVGSTTRPVVERYGEHFRNRSNASNQYARKYGREIISYATIEKCDSKDAMFEAEYYWTKYYSLFFNLVNLDFGKKHGKTFFEKMSGENNVMFGKHHTEETKAKLRKWALEQPVSESDRQKGVLARTGVPCSEYRREAIRKALKEKYAKESPTFNFKKVLLKNTGEIFESIKSASEHYNVPATHITANCKGKRKSAGKNNGVKLCWEYVE